MKNSNVIEFKKKNEKSVEEQYELEGGDSELLELAQKLIACNPSALSVSKCEIHQNDFLQIKNKHYHNENIKLLEIEDLDAVAGGILSNEAMPENDMLISAANKPVEECPYFKRGNI